MTLFAGHERAHGTHGVPTQKTGTVKWEIKTTAETLRQPVSLQMWEAHLAGTRPLGVVPIREDGTTSWGSIDVDRYDINLMEVCQRVESQKLPLLPGRSKSGGLHLFLFLKEPAPAGAVQAVLRDIAAQLGFAGSEIFPKQTVVLTERGDVGNWMVMPYYGDTYGGKIKEQVGLKKTGAEMTVGEFLDAAERLRVPADALGTIGKRRQAAGKKGPSGTAPAGPYADGPPCLQHLAALGVPPGGQNNTLLMMGIYYKKTFPEDWEDKLELANREQLRPPGSSEGLQSVIRSLKKKEYEYTCKTEPMASHCDSMACRMRKFGVGAGGNFPQITSISKLDVEPPIWFVDIEGERVDASTEQLQTYMMFHRLCIDRLHKCYNIMKPGDWLGMVAAAMDGLTVIEAPPDAAAGGQFRELLTEFLTNRAQGDKIEDLFSGRPFVDAKDSLIYFRLSDFQTFLRRAEVRDIKRGQIVQRIRDLGGESDFKNVKGKGLQCWKVPTTLVEGPPEVDPPTTERSPV